MTHEMEMTAGSEAGRGVAEEIGLEQYYSEAGPDYAAWSAAYNMHFGYFDWAMNPLDREAMLERMNVEVLRRLRVEEGAAARLLDMGCGLGTTLRSFAGRLPHAALTGITVVPWQIEQGERLNACAAGGERIRLIAGDYHCVPMPAGTMDGVYALESSCHARGADKGGLLREAYRMLRPGGRVVLTDGFLDGDAAGMPRWQRRIYETLCRCWVIEELGDLRRVTEQMERIGFEEVRVERLQLRVAASVGHVPWVTAKFLLSEVVLGERRMTRARWNNVLAPVLLPLVSWPLGPMVYCMVSAVKRR